MKRGANHIDSVAKKTRASLNSIPPQRTQPLNVYMFGSGTICELGLGPRVTEVKRPRLNPLLPANDVGIVQVACGGAHSIGIDVNGHIWSWGQNDGGALGRPSKESDDEIDEDNDLNAKESTPQRVEGLSENTVFVAVGATDNISAGITADGRVWAWGTFTDDGRKCFRPGVRYQREPWLVPTVRGAVALAGGKDHLLILDKNGKVWAWGTGQSRQLGVVVSSNLRTHTFGPFKVPVVKDIVSIAAGDFQSFAIDKNGKVFAWGLNNFGQLGISEGVGSGAMVDKPTEVEFFTGKHVAQIASGSHHTVWLTEDGDIWTVGETNFHQLGVPYDDLPADTVREKDGTPSYITTPVKLSKGAFDEEPVALPKFKFIAAGTDHSLAISKEDGSTWTWGFGEVYQLGHGKPAGEDSPEDEPVPTRIKNTATTGVNMCWAGAGGQFSVIAAEA